MKFENLVYFQSRFPGKRLERWELMPPREKIPVPFKLIARLNEVAIDDMSTITITNQDVPAATFRGSRSFDRILLTTFSTTPIEKHPAVNAPKEINKFVANPTVSSLNFLEAVAC